MTDATPERIAKLPVWAREHLASLERERDRAVAAHRAYLDSQTESNIWFRDRETGERIYLNEAASEKINITSRCGRVHLAVTCYHDDRIELSWSGGQDVYGLGDCCFIPTSYQQARIVHPANASVR